jgi:uncharacterized RDD family membrane protein YckC
MAEFKKNNLSKYRISEINRYFCKSIIYKYMNMKHMCPNCLAEFEDGEKFCKSCGSNLSEIFILNPVCPKCGKTFSEGCRFCDVDGEKLCSPDDLIPRCTKCGKEYSADVKFCPVDGGKVLSLLSIGYRNKKTVEGINQKADLGKRFVASLIDSAIIGVLSIFAIVPFSIGITKLSSYYSSDEATGYFVLAALLYLIPIIYSLLKDGMFNGQSIGKKTMGLTTVSIDTKLPCSLGESCIRNLVSSLVSFIPIEPILVLVTDDGRKLGDKAAGTIVINN